MSEVDDAILKAVPHNSWQTGDQIRRRAEEILQDEISIGDFYSTMERYIRTGLVELHREKPKAKGKFRRTSGTKPAVQEGELVPA